MHDSPPPALRRRSFSPLAAVALIAAALDPRRLLLFSNETAEPTPTISFPSAVSKSQRPEDVLAAVRPVIKFPPGPIPRNRRRPRFLGCRQRGCFTLHGKKVRYHFDPATSTTNRFKRITGRDFCGATGCYAAA